MLVAGGPEVLLVLEAMQPKEFGLGTEGWEFVRAGLLLRLGLPAVPRQFPRKDQWWHWPVSASELTTWRAQLEGEGDGKQFAAGYLPEQAFIRLTFFDPASAARWLSARKAEEELPRGWPHLSRFAAYFGDCCPTNRAELLRSLLGTSNLNVRVMAAMGLRRDDESSALAAIRLLRSVSGDPGALACLELARRGDKTAMDSLARRFASPPPGAVATSTPSRFAWPINSEALALLSNSARASGLPPLQAPYDEWWRAHRQTIALADPWLETMNRH